MIERAWVAGRNKDEVVGARRIRSYDNDAIRVLFPRRDSSTQLRACRDGARKLVRRNNSKSVRRA
jgi:hypothetical protein